MYLLEMDPSERNYVYILKFPVCIFLEMNPLESQYIFILELPVCIFLEELRMQTTFNVVDSYGIDIFRCWKQNGLGVCDGGVIM